MTWLGAVVQAQRFGVEILSPRKAVGVRTEPLPDHQACGRCGNLATLMIASGCSGDAWAPGIDRLQGSGVIAGAGCGALLQGRQVYIVGGANSAGQAAMVLPNSRNAW